MTADAASVSPLVIGNPGNGEVRFAGAGGGGGRSLRYRAIARATVERSCRSRLRSTHPWRAGG